MPRFTRENDWFLTRKVVVRLGEQQHSDLEKSARKMGVSISFIVRHLVTRFLEMERQTDFYMATPGRVRGGDHGKL